MLYQLSETESEDSATKSVGTPSVEKHSPAKIPKLDNPFQQNRKPLKNLACACDRFQISDRAGAAIATSVLEDWLQKMRKRW